MGGVSAVPYSWPAQILLKVNHQVDKNLLRDYKTCGATLIDAYTIITAASCIMPKFLKYNDTYSFFVSDSLNPLRYEVYVGAYDISLIHNGKKPKYPTVKVPVQNIIKVITRF